MREIKFRAWDKKLGEMLFDCQVSIDWKSYLYRPEVFDLMQYTGLKDKNGKEIYEADHLRHIDSEGRLSESEFKVVWHEASFYLAWADDMLSVLLNEIQASSMVIVGNGYEG